MARPLEIHIRLTLVTPFHTVAHLKILEIEFLCRYRAYSTPALL